MDIKAIKGINEKREQDFKKLGVTDTRGLISFFPRAYLDLRKRQLRRRPDVRESRCRSERAVFGTPIEIRQSRL